MLDIWYGDIPFANCVIIFSLIVILPIQILICFKAKSIFVRFIPIIVLTAAVLIWIILSLAVAGWEGSLYLFVAIYLLFMIFVCGIGWGVWALIKYKGAKKKWIFTFLAVLAAVGFAWNYGYQNRKSNDNLPDLLSIAQMDEAEVNNILSGYKRTQLLELWGEPQFSNSSEDVWFLNNTDWLTVNYKNDNEKVVVCGIGPMLFPEYIKDITYTYSVYSSDYSRQLNSEEIADVKDWALGLDLLHVDLPDGEAPNEVYAGGESYTFVINNGEKEFSYLYINDYYIFLRDQWYLVENPSEPPISDESDVVKFHDKTLKASDLSEKTLEWLNWYNELPREDQLAVSFIPPELYDLCGYPSAGDESAVQAEEE